MIQLAGLGTYEAGQPFEKSRSIVLMFTGQSALVVFHDVFPGTHVLRGERRLWS